MVGVNPCIYWLTIDQIQKEAVLCHILYLHQKMKLLNIYRAGQVCFEDLLTNLDIHILF